MKEEGEEREESQQGLARSPPKCPWGMHGPWAPYLRFQDRSMPQQGPDLGSQDQAVTCWVEGQVEPSGLTVPPLSKVNALIDASLIQEVMNTSYQKG